MYDHSTDTVLHGTGEETFDAVKMLRSADPSKYKPAPGADYPKGRFGDSLRQLAQLIKANLGVQVAFADIGGWDHHVNEGATEGQIANVLRDFSQALAAFWTDLGDLGEDTVVVTMSEFGRTARENGNRGTDHGHANVMFVLGGPVKGGKVYGRWPGLDQSQLYEGRDLALTTDFRQVLGEAVARHMGNKNLNEVFPGYGNQPGKFLRFLGKRRRSAATKELSPLADTISSGENPLRHASQSVISKSAIVIKTFGHAFSPHCPRQTSRSDDENGARYGIGH